MVNGRACAEEIIVYNIYICYQIEHWQHYYQDRPLYMRV